MRPAARALLGGGIGSGKSTAAALFAAMGAAVLSADRAAHTVLEPGQPAAADVARRWPETVEAGRIERPRLAAIVFSDEDARRELEDITHPAIARLLGEQVAASRAEVVLVEMPLPIALLGPGWPWVVVDAPDEVRLARLLTRGMSAADAARRMAAQPSREDWRRRADLVLDNGAGFDHLEAECRWAWPVIRGWHRPDDGTVAP